MATIRKLTDPAEVEPLLAAPGRLWLFKHSLTCGTSARAWRRFQSFAGARADGGGAEFAMVEIQRARDVSRAIAERTRVRHESPQALLLDGGEVLWHDSHWRIDEAALAAAEAAAGTATGADACSGLSTGAGPPAEAAAGRGDTS